MQDLVDFHPMLQKHAGGWCGEHTLSACAGFPWQMGATGNQIESASHGHSFNSFPISMAKEG